MKKKTVSFLLIAAMIFTSLSFLEPFSNSYAEESKEPGASATVLDLSQGNIIITSTGATGGGLATPETVLNPDGYIINGGGVETDHTVIIGKPANQAQNFETRVKFSNLNMKIKPTPQKMPGVALMSGSKVYLTLEGDNVIDASARANAPAIGINEALEDKNLDPAHLIIGGTGSLTALGGQRATGIGGIKKSSGGSGSFGKLTINSGHIIAKGDKGAENKSSNNTAAIGGNGKVGKGGITINGGKVEAVINTEKDTPAIMFRTPAADPDSMITINGGNVIASNIGNSANSIDIGEDPVISPGDSRAVINGGSVYGKVQDVPKNSSRESVYPVKVKTNPAVIDKEITCNRQDGSSWTAYTDSNGELMMYLPVSTEYIAFNVDDGGTDTLYYKTAVTVQENSSNEYTMEKYTGTPCQCTLSTSSIKFDDQAYDINKTIGYKDIELNATFIKNPACTYPIHAGKKTYSFVGAVDPADAEISGNKLTAKEGAIGKTFNIKAEAVINGKTYEKTAQFTFSSDDNLMFDLDQGDIEISGGGSENIKVKVGSVTRQVAPDSELTIVQKDSDIKRTYNTVTIESHTVLAKPIKIKDLNMYRRNMDKNRPSFWVKSNAEIKLEGTNKIEHDRHVSLSPMQVRTPATLTISGDGKLEAVVAIGTEEPAIAARGDGSHLIINSGTISASGGKTAIGSADQGIDAYVTINGGHITAVGKDYAYDHASGIASLGNLHKTVINGGYVNASALKVVDNSEQSGFAGGLEINGGSVFTKIPPRVKPVDSQGNTLELYTVKTEDVVADQKVKVTFTKELSNDTDDTPVTFDTYTDGESKLYFYIPDDGRWHRTKTEAAGENYYKRIKPSSSDPSLNTGTAIKNAPKKIVNFAFKRQKEVQIDEANKTIRVTMKSGVLLLGMWKATVEIEGSSYYPTADQEIIGHETVPIKYTVVGEDGSKAVYNVFIKSETPTGDEPAVIDVSNGEIVINESGITVNGTAFAKNPKGYILTGTCETGNGSVSIEGNVAEPILLKSLNIKTTGDRSPIEIRGKAKLTMSENVELTATKDRVPAIDVSGTSNKLTLQGDGVVTLKAGAEAPAIGTSKTGSQNPATSGLGDVTVLSGTLTMNAGDGCPAVGFHKGDPNTSSNGKFIIDGGSLRLNDAANADPNLSIQAPVNSDGARVYSVTVKTEKQSVITNTLVKVSTLGVGETEIKTQGYCTTDGDGKIYIYKPLGWISISTEAGTNAYWGTVKVLESGTNLTVGKASVKDFSFTQPQSFKEIDLPLEVIGENVGGKIMVYAKYKGDTAASLPPIALEGQALLNDQGKYVAVIKFPANDSLRKDKIYNLKVTLNGHNQVLDGTQGDTYVLMPILLKILKLEFEQQLDLEDPNPSSDPNIKETLIGKTIFGQNAANEDYIKVKLPYDYADNPKFGDRLRVSEWDYNGKSTIPDRIKVGREIRYYGSAHPERNRISIFPVTLPISSTGNVRKYNLQVIEQERPKLNSIEILDSGNNVITSFPDYKGKRVKIKLNGEYLDNVKNSLMHYDPATPTITPLNYREIVVECRDYGSGAELLAPVKATKVSGEWVAEFDIPSNMTEHIQRYEFQVRISNVLQLTSSGHTNIPGSKLEIPAQEIPKINDIEFTQPASYNQDSVEISLKGVNLSKDNIIDYGSTVTGIGGNTDGKVIVNVKGLNGNPAVTVPVEAAYVSDTLWKATVPLDHIANKDYDSDKEYPFDVTVAGISQKDNLTSLPANKKKIIMPKQAKPKVTGFEFTPFADYKAGTVTLKVKGDLLDDVVNAPTGDGKIHVSAHLEEVPGDYVAMPADIGDVTAVKSGSGEWEVVMNVPMNKSYLKDAKYKLSVNLSGFEQTGLINGTVTVPKQQKPEATDFEFTPFADYKAGTVTLKVKGNKLDDVVNAPTGDGKIHVSAHLKEVPGDYAAMPADIGDVTAVKSGSGEWEVVMNVPMNKSYLKNAEYKLSVNLSGFDQDNVTNDVIMLPKQPKPEVKSIEFTSTLLKPADEDEYPDPNMRVYNTFNGGEITVTLIGDNLDNILDAPSGDKKVMLKANLKRKAGDSEPGSDTVGPVELTKGAAGKWKGKITLPQNGSFMFEKLYELSVEVSGYQQDTMAKTTVIVPLKYQRKIVKFAIDEQVKPAEINHDNKTIKVIVKVGTNLKNLNPVIELSEASSVYAPLNHHDFSAPVEYTVTSVDGYETKYTVIVKEEPFFFLDLDKDKDKDKNKDKDKDKNKDRGYIRGIPLPDGSSAFEPDKGMSRAEVAQIIANVSMQYDQGSKYANKFKDIKEKAWYSSVVGFASEKGIIKGFPNGTFRPLSEITREEFAAMVVRFSGIDIDKVLKEKGVKKQDPNTSEYHIDYPFSDIAGLWSEDYISALYAMDWVKGYKDGTFKPKNSITRVEAVKIMNAVLGLKIEKDDLDKAEPKFVDVPKSHWAYYEIMTAATKYIKPKPDTEKKKDEAK